MSPSPERRREAEKEDVAFSGSSESIRASLSLSSVVAPGEMEASGRSAERGPSEVDSSGSRSPGESSKEVVAFPDWSGLREGGVGDVGSSESGDGVMELAASGEGVWAATTGCGVL